MKTDQGYLNSMDFNQLRYATGIVSTREAVTQVLDELEAIDFPMNKVFVFPLNAKHKKPNKSADADQRSMTPIEGAKAGLVTGGATGGLLAITAGLGTLVISGVGPALAVESVLAILLASGASATFGSLVGTFHGWFAPEKQARLCASYSSPEFLVMIESTVDQIRQAECILRYWRVQEWYVYECSD